MDHEAFIAGQNVAKFRELLCREIDPGKRRMLERLIEEERGKLEPPAAAPSKRR